MTRYQPHFAIAEDRSSARVEINQSVIDAIDTLRNRPNSRDPPAIIVKFISRTDAEEMLAKRRQKIELYKINVQLPTETSIYVNETFIFC
ncbi:hypothetical protein J6590_074125 [Homalodisca vitripennis]|nr:hypothetical protein J6590_074125 [Homalodisca vitripennis]